MHALKNIPDSVIFAAVISVALGLVAVLLVFAMSGTGSASTDSSTQPGNAGMTIGTNGRPYIGVGGNLSIDPGSGKLGITSGGITIPLG